MCHLACCLILRRRADPSPMTTSALPGQLDPLSGVSIFFAVVCVLIMLFSGSCTLLFLGSFLLETQGGENYVTAPVILILGGPPFLVGLAIWLLALRAGRRRGK